MALKKKQLNHLREKLLVEKAEILGIKRQKGDESSLQGDLVDQSTGLSEQEMLLELAEHDRERMLEIDDALKRLEDKTYGICLESGEEIPYERLEAVPRRIEPGGDRDPDHALLDGRPPARPREMDAARRHRCQ